MALKVAPMEVRAAGLGMLRVVCLFAVFDAVCLLDSGMLFPRESPSGEVKELNGLWDFRADDSTNRNQTFERARYKKRLAEVSRAVVNKVNNNNNNNNSEK